VEELTFEDDIKDLKEGESFMPSGKPSHVHIVEIFSFFSDESLLGVTLEAAVTVTEKGRGWKV
jgi:hypothetical protein